MGVPTVLSAAINEAGNTLSVTFSETVDTLFRHDQNHLGLSLSSVLGPVEIEREIPQVRPDWVAGTVVPPSATVELIVQRQVITRGDSLTLASSAPSGISSVSTGDFVEDFTDLVVTNESTVAANLPAIADESIDPRSYRVGEWVAKFGEERGRILYRIYQGLIDAEPELVESFAIANEQQFVLERLADSYV